MRIRSGRTPGLVLGLVLMLAAGIGVWSAARPATAQEATPGSDGAADCVSLSRDEVVAETETLVGAMQAGNILALVTVLGEETFEDIIGPLPDATPDASSEATPGSIDDEFAQIVASLGATFEVTHLLVDDQTATVRYTFGIPALDIDGSAIVLITYECGEVADIQQDSTELGRQVGRAEAAADATPVP